MDVFDDVKPQQKKIDFDPPLGNLMHDHYGEDNE
jgi:hypothetical protein